MNIEREEILDKLIQSQNHHLVKFITGIRRCGKSYLLFTIFRNYLRQKGIDDSHIIAIDLEKDESISLRDPIVLGEHIRKLIPHDGQSVYVLLDEIQLVKKVLPDGIDLARVHPDDRNDCYVTFYDVLNGLLNTPNVITYVTGSNAKMLSKDIATQFRGRSEIIHITPLSFREYLSTVPASTERSSALMDYFLFGGLPECVLMETPDEKREYLKHLYETIYLQDIINRNKIKNDAVLKALADVIMSGIGGLVNPSKLANTVTTTMRIPTNHVTVANYLDFIEDSFLIQKAKRYDVKGKRYFDSPSKYYAADTGIRNIHIAQRQSESTHLMENVIFNELTRRGYDVDVGHLESFSRPQGTTIRSTHEINFVVNCGYERIYIQSAWMIPDDEKMAQETFSLKHTGDSFKKVVIDGQLSATYRDNDGICHISLIDFLLNPHSLETL